MKNKEKQIERMIKDLKENLRLCAGVKLLDHQVETIAYELLKKYQPKIPKDSIILSKEEYEKTILEKLKLGIEIGKRQARKEMAEKFINLPKSKILTVIHDYEEIKVVELNELQELAEQFDIEIKE